MKILCVDGMNFLHRARSGFQLGPAPVAFNFFRNLRSLIEVHKPTRCILVLEGHPTSRYEALPEYKANRKVEADSPKAVELKKFFAQKDEIIKLLEKFPVSVMRHPNHECDDVIFNLVKKATPVVPWVVVSNDSDFTQLVGEFSHVSVYNPMLKKYVEESPYDYVTWKALRGDGSDNIPGIPGCGDKTAAEVASDPQKLQEYLSDPERLSIFERNYKLISFIEWSAEESTLVTCSQPEKDWEGIKEAFTAWGFNSMTKEPAWMKFTSTFDQLWGD